MTQTVTHFVDPTIPGLSASDLHNTFVAAKRTDIRLRKALAGLTPRLLCDLGLDRFGA